jgi:sulfhydrogenase subunit beta (sulfur reductase)
MQYLHRDQIIKALDRLTEGQTLIAPKNIDGVILYRKIHNGDEIVWDFTLPVLSIKEFFFPATERLMTIQKGRREADDGHPQLLIDVSIPDEKAVIFGVRPCDARGLKALDTLFLETDPPDLYYAKRRENSTLIGLACKEMAPTCFCTSLGGAPDDPSDVDLMLTEFEEGFAVQVITEKGEAFIGDLQLKELEADLPRPTLNSPVALPSSESWSSAFDDPYWEALAERCLSCRICAYVCPVCRCFDVRDELLDVMESGIEIFERIRCWDSCAGEGYRRIAGGHNPRSTKGQRLRNRFLCKFHYYPQQYGAFACVGCGRCIDACPVNIDITEVMAHVAAIEPEVVP